MNSVLVFDVFGDYAQFKKYFTNMSPLTFDIPSRTALAGIIGAIGGVPKEKNPEFFSKDDCFLSLQILSDLRKTKISLNYLKTVSKTEISRFKNHKPTNVEFLKNPRYRIFFHHDNQEFFDKFCTLVKEHKAIYTPALGIAGCLANYELVGIWKIEAISSDKFIEVSSIVLEENIEDIEFNAEVKIKRTTLPLEMKNDREVTKYGKILYEASGKRMSLKIKEAFCLLNTSEYICEF